MKIRLFLQSFDFGFRISDLEFRVSYITLRIPNPKSNDAFFQKVKDIISPIGKQAATAIVTTLSQQFSKSERCSGYRSRTAGSFPSSLRFKIMTAKEHYDNHFGDF